MNIFSKLSHVNFLKSNNKIIGKIQENPGLYSFLLCHTHTIQE